MNKKYIKLIGTAGIVIIAVAGGGIVGLPILNENSVRAAEKSALVSTNDGLSSQLASLTYIQQNSAILDNKNDELTASFPNIPNGANIIENITAAAAGAGLSSSAVTNIAFDVPTAISSTGEAVDPNAAAPAPAAETPAEAPAAAPVTPGATGELGGSTQDIQKNENGDAVISGGLDDPLPGSNEAPIAPGAEAPIVPGTSSDPAAAANPLATMGINVSVEGTEAQVLDFAKRFNEMSRTIKIKTLSLGAEGTNTSLNLTGTTYLYIDVLTPTPAVVAPVPVG